MDELETSQRRFGMRKLTGSTVLSTLFLLNVVQVVSIFSGLALQGLNATTCPKCPCVHFSTSTSFIPDVASHTAEELSIWPSACRTGSHGLKTDFIPTSCALLHLVKTVPKDSRCSSCRMSRASLSCNSS